MEHDQQFFVILDHFLSFYPSNNSKAQNFEKWKIHMDTPIIIHMCTINIHMCTINDNHIIYGLEIWSVTNRKNLLSSWTLAFYPCNNPENQNFEKKCKKPQEILSTCYAQHRWQSHDTWFLKHRAQQTEVLVTLDNFLPFYPMTQKINILTKRLEIPLFYKGVPKILIIFLRYDVWNM